ncbi:SRPBCC family protein [Mycolicibacterium sp. XJ870]
MVRAQATTSIQCKPDELLELVMDIERYAEVDDKIRPVYWSRRSGNVVEFRFRPKFPGLPLRAPKLAQRVELTPGRRIDITNAALPHNKIGNRMSDFVASFVCEPIDDATVVTRTVEITFRAPLRWLMDLFLRRRLQASVDDELARAKDLLESADAR